ncbi:phytoene desaturase family protein [Halobacillus campisalis]|uniref:4,4'-diaponeurosporene oxygenase n=1 Tax=Halobacillus campisalis TaxID=435909 RepID=A0ABW2K3M2_9BACI|nr:phytoene desaturase family protein [Halobacillus campisalis]
MKTIIIGGGLGGLSSAVTLAKHGVDVELFEKNEHFGGKMMDVKQDGYHFDFGPNTITMPHVFKQIVSQAGLVPEEELPFIQIENHTRNQFEDGTIFDFSTDRSYMKEQFSRLDPKGMALYDEFLTEVHRLYTLSNRHFLNRSFTGYMDYLSPELFASMAKVRPFESMDHFFKKYFQNSHIIQSLNRYATYTGSNPYTSPATFAMIAHLELGDGVYYLPGGNTKIAESFVKAAKKLGATLHNRTEVVKLITDSNRITGVKLSNGQVVEADHVILNGDLLSSLPMLLKDEERPSFSDRIIHKMDASTSAYVILAGLNTKIDPLHHHHVVFSKDYKKEFQMLKNQEYSEDPTIYVCTSSKTDPSISPQGDNCFILVNAPPLNNNESAPEGYKDLIYSKLKRTGLPLSDYVAAERVIDPGEIQSTFRAYRGSIYGPSSNTRLQAFRRPFNKSQDYSNLYFCGGSTHPGGGSPMVVLSGQNVANHILGKIVSIE